MPKTLQAQRRAPRKASDLRESGLSNALRCETVRRPAEAHEAHAWIRLQVAAQDPDRASRVRILYGGSVKPDNMDGLLATPDVDGVLVGGAALDPVAFARLVQARSPS